MLNPPFLSLPDGTLAAGCATHAPAGAGSGDQPRLRQTAPLRASRTPTPVLGVAGSGRIPRKIVQRTGQIDTGSRAADARSVGFINALKQSARPDAARPSDSPMPRNSPGRHIGARALRDTPGHRLAVQDRRSASPHPASPRPDVASGHPPAGSGNATCSRRVGNRTPVSPSARSRTARRTRAEGRVTWPQVPSALAISSASVADISALRAQHLEVSRARARIDAPTSVAD